MSQKKPRKTLRNRNGSVWISDKVRAQIIEYYKSTGESLVHIGNKFGVSHTCIQKIITQYFKKKA